MDRIAHFHKNKPIGGYKKQDFVKYLKINNLQNPVVPRAGLEPARPFRAKGFSYHYGFRHHSLFVVRTIPSPWIWIILNL